MITSKGFQSDPVGEETKHNLEIVSTSTRRQIGQLRVNDEIPLSLLSLSSILQLLDSTYDGCSIYDNRHGLESARPGCSAQRSVRDGRAGRRRQRHVRSVRGVRVKEGDQAKTKSHAHVADAEQRESTSFELVEKREEKRRVRTDGQSGTLRKLNAIVIPIVYSDKFYKDVLAPELDAVNKLIYYGDIPVGACCCRFDHLGSGSGSASTPPTLVILTLA